MNTPIGWLGRSMAAGQNSDMFFYPLWLHIKTFAALVVSVECCRLINNIYCFQMY